MYVHVCHSMILNVIETGLEWNLRSNTRWFKKCQGTVYENCSVNDPLEPQVGDDCEAAIEIDKLIIAANNNEQ